MTKLEIYSLSNKLIGTIEVSKEESYNKRLRMDKTLLDYLLVSGIKMPYGCMGGSCGACIVEILDGAEFIDREGSHKIVLKSLAENEALTCITTIKEFDNNPTVKLKLKFEADFTIK
ncbi:MAG: 2Fe-2S iron-sulfur cluster binding domain-containing protein [Nanoarchaeales archaeon]|nr:2Fe-2S iron-sulfur cluster binding domain-containing protein [Nanoarchaeales archaeon]